MNKTLNYLNLAGVLALSALSVAQWRYNSRLMLASHNLQAVQVAQTSKIADQERLLKSNASEMNDLHDRLESAGIALKDKEKALATVLGQRDRLVEEQTRLKGELERWQAALAERDQSLKTEAEKIEKLAGERNLLTQKFNDLAGKYNSVVKSLDDAKAKLANR